VRFPLVAHQTFENSVFTSTIVRTSLLGISRVFVVGFVLPLGINIVELDRLLLFAYSKNDEFEMPLSLFTQLLYWQSFALEVTKYALINVFLQEFVFD
jgi:hypothetical protein